MFVSEKAPHQKQAFSLSSDSLPDPVNPKLAIEFFFVFDFLSGTLLPVATGGVAPEDDATLATSGVTTCLLAAEGGVEQHELTPLSVSVGAFRSFCERLSPSQVITREPTVKKRLWKSCKAGPEIV